MKKPTKPPGKGKAKAARKRPTKTARRPFLEPTGELWSVDEHGKLSPPRQHPDLVAFDAAAAEVLVSVQRLIRLAHDLRISRQGVDGMGPHETETSRDVASALFVARRALEATGAYAIGTIFPAWRRQLRGAHNLLRGGRVDGAPGDDRKRAVSLAKQIIGRVVGYGYAVPGDEGTAVADTRAWFSGHFGSVFQRAPPDSMILAHVSSDSRAATAMTKLRTGTWPADTDFHHEMLLAAQAFAADVIWAGHVEAGASPAEIVFRFPMGSASTRAKLLTLLQQESGNAKRARRNCCLR